MVPDARRLFIRLWLGMWAAWLAIGVLSELLVTGGHAADWFSPMAFLFVGGASLLVAAVLLGLFWLADWLRRWSSS